MIRALVIALLLGGVAHAGFITPPKAFPADAEQGRSLAAKANEVSHFGGAPALATVEVWRFPDSPGTLYVTAVAAKVTEHREAAIRVAVDSFHEEPNRAQLSGAKAVVDRWEESVDPKTQHIVARLEWHDESSATSAVLVVAADSENVVAVTGQCVTGPTTRPAHKDLCAAQLKTVDPGIAAAKRVAIALAPSGTEPPPGPSALGPKPTLRPQASMTDGSRAPLPPISLATETKRTTDRRPVYVGLGIVLLAAVFWLNRRRRDREGVKESSDDDER